MEDEREAKRLADKVDATSWVERYLAPHLQPGMRVLDAGCGPGVISAAIAAINRRIEVVALDASPARAAVAEATLDSCANAEVVQGDVQQLPFPDSSFDLVYCRFLLEYVPDKQRAVNELVRVLQPGGTILLQDLDGQLVNHYPPDPELQAGINSALAVLATTGFDPHLGRKLHDLLARAGITTASLQAESYHFIVGTIDPVERGQWQLKLEIAARALDHAGFDSADILKDRFLAYLDRRDTLSFSQLFTARGLKHW
jgi:ubiquinone/menaquinone biosynthesis C-methylase UbiE